MPRRALLFSVALHAVLLILAIRLTTGMSAHPGDSSLCVRLIPEEAGGPLVAEALSAAAPESDVTPPELEPPSAPSPTLELPAPVITTPAPDAAFALAPPSPPREVPALSPAKKSRSQTRVAAAASRTAASHATAEGTSGQEGASGKRTAGYVPPQFRLRYKPPYPEEARAQRLEGTVLLLVSVDAEGRTVEVRLARSCGHALLDRVALQTVKSWRFSPARRAGVAVAAQVEVPVQFRFEERRTPA